MEVATEEEVPIAYIPQHCLFCLNKLQFRNGDEKKRKNTLKSCDSIWRYFIDKWERKRRITFISINRTLGEDEGYGSGVPPMCEVCEGKVSELDKLHRKLEAKLKEIEELMVKRSRKYWEDLKENVESESTARFLEELRIGSGGGFSGTEADSNWYWKDSEPCTRLGQDSHHTPDDVQIKVELEENDLHDSAEDCHEMDVGSGNTSVKRVSEGHKHSVKTINERCKPVSRKRKKRYKKRGPYKKRVVYLARHGCDICGVRMPYTELVDHLQGHVKDYVVKCPNPNCTHSYSNPLALERFHLGSCKPGTKACKIAAGGDKRLERICEVCGFKATWLSTFKKHLRLHDSDSNFECPVEGCGKAFGTRQAVEIHIFTHSRANRTDESLPCIQCKRKGKAYSAEDMETHLREEHGAADELVRCYVDGCSHPFLNRDDLVYHLQKRHGDPEGHPCDLCGDEMKYRRLSRHFLERHNVGSGFQCEFCAKLFSSIVSFQTHNKNCKQEHLFDTTDNSPAATRKKKKKVYVCTECPKNVDDGDESKVKVYSTDSHELYMRHMASAHGVKGKTHTCPSCPYKEFLTRRDLQGHIERVHGDKSKFACGIDGCSKSYSSFTCLRLHRNRSHPKVPHKRLECDKCDKTFKYRKNLKFHQETIHEGKEPPRVVCVVCGGRYSEKSIKQHMLIHQGLKPYQCDQCSQCFRQKSTLGNHQRIHCSM